MPLPGARRGSRLQFQWLPEEVRRELLPARLPDGATSDMQPAVAIPMRARVDPAIFHVNRMCTSLQTLRYTSSAKERN
jgi:hypothetical protein